jgi:hypothetical protein
VLRGFQSVGGACVLSSSMLNEGRWGASISAGGGLNTAKPAVPAVSIYQRRSIKSYAPESIVERAIETSVRRDGEAQV